MNSTTPSAFPRPDKSTAGQPTVEVCEVRVFRSNAEIEEVRDLWMRWQDDLNAVMDFYLLINQLREQVIRPHVVLVLCGGKPKAMAIGRLEDGSVKLKFGYKSIANFPVRTLHVIHGGLLGEQTPEVADAILNSLKQSLRSGEAEMLTFSGIHVGSAFAKRLPEKMSIICCEHFAGRNIHWKMALGHTMDEIYARLGHHRQHLRRQIKIFEKAFPGGLSIRCFRAPAELDQMTAAAEEIARTSYQRGLGVGFMDNEENRSRLAFEARKGWLRMYVLYLKAKPCAYCWGTMHNSTFWCNAIGFDGEYRKYSPGTYLIIKTLEDLCQQGIKEIDLGFGEAQYKRQFGNQHGYEIFINVFAARPRLIALNMAKTLNNGLKAGALALAGRFNAVQMIKKRWRAKLAPRKDNSQ